MHLTQIANKDNDKSRFMEGMESGCIILIQNSGSIATTTASGVSRARSRLIIFSSEEDDTMRAARAKNLVE